MLCGYDVSFGRFAWCRDHLIFVVFHVARNHCKYHYKYHYKSLINRHKRKLKKSLHGVIFASKIHLMLLLGNLKRKSPQIWGDFCGDFTEAEIATYTSISGTPNGHGSMTNTTNKSTLLPVMSSQSSKKASKLRLRHHLRDGPDFRYGSISIAKFVFINLACTALISFLDRSSLR